VGPNKALAPVTEFQTTTAYNWLCSHYKFLESFTGRRGDLHTAADDKQRWTEVLAHVLIDQFGFLCRRTEDENMPGRVRVIPSSFWQELDVQIPQFTVWLRDSVEYTSLGPLPAERTACVHCKEVTVCRFQAGLAVCEAPMAEGAHPHRNLNMPLDVIRKDDAFTFGDVEKMQRVMIDGAKERMEMEDECEVKGKKEDNGVEENLLVDRLLRCVGFAGGRASTNTVSYESMRQAIEMATPFSDMEIAEAFELYDGRVDLTKWTAETVKLVKCQVGMVLKSDVHTDAVLTRVRVRQGGGVRVSTWKLG
jgi:hypothetical protein